MTSACLSLEAGSSCGVSRHSWMEDSVMMNSISVSNHLAVTICNTASSGARAGSQQHTRSTSRAGR